MAADLPRGQAGSTGRSCIFGGAQLRWCGEATGAEPIQSLQSEETAADVFTYRVVDLDGETSSLATVGQPAQP